MNIVRFRYGPLFRFNGGSPLAIAGTNLLTTFDKQGGKIVTPLPDDEWFARHQEELDAKAEKYADDLIDRWVKARAK